MAFLNYNGLKRYDKKTKEYIEDKIKKLNDIDVDELVTKAELDAKANKSDIFSGDYNDLTNKPNIPDTTNLAAKTDLATHTNNDNIHVTSSEKSKWNAKLDNTDLKDYATKVYVTDEIAKASTSGKVDLSGYAKTVDVNASLSNKVDKVTGKSLISNAEIARLATINNYDDTDIKNALNKKADKTELFSGSYNDLTDKPTIPDVSSLASKAELKNHTDDTGIHITSSERTKWNNKLDNTSLTNYATKTYVTDEIAKAATGGKVDLSGYAKTADVNAGLSNKVDKVEGKSLISNAEITRLAQVDNYDDTDIKRSINAKASTADLNSHTSNNSVHITSAERTKWNNKAEMSDIPSLTNYATKTYVTDEINKASLSGTVDLSEYAKTADVNTSLNNKVDKTNILSAMSSNPSDDKLLSEKAIYNVLLNKPSVYDDSETEKYFHNTSANEFVNMLSPAVNLGNTLDCHLNAEHPTAPDTIIGWETLWNNVETTKEIMETYKKVGFKTIRIPVTWYEHMDVNGVIASEWLARVKVIVDWAIESGLIVIINAHHDTNEGNYINAVTSDYEASKAHLINIWTQVGEYFADYDNRLVFESMNECLNPNLSDKWHGDTESFEVINKLNQVFVNTVRNQAWNRNRFLLVPTYAAGTSTEVTSAFIMPRDNVKDRLIVEVHTYNTTIGKIKSAQASVRMNLIERGFPVFLGEYGIRPSEVTDETERLNLLQLQTKMFREMGVGVCIWDNGNGSYKLLNRKTYKFYYPDIVNGIIKSSNKHDFVKLPYLDENYNIKDISNWKEGKIGHSDGEYDSSGTHYFTSDQHLIPRYSSYIVSMNDHSNDRLLVVHRDKNMKMIGKVETKTNGGTITISANDRYIDFCYYNKSTTSTLTKEQFAEYINNGYLQINKADNATQNFEIIEQPLNEALIDLDKRIGNSSSVDLTGYAKTSDVNTSLSNKVDKVDGKGLSTNDYTTEEKTKVSKIVTSGDGSKFLANDGTYKKVGSSASAAVAERKFKPVFGFDTYWGEMRDTQGNKNQVDLARIKEQIDQCEAMKVDRIICTVHIGWDETTNSLVIAENTDSLLSAISYCADKNVTIDTVKVHIQLKGASTSENNYVNNVIGMSTFQTKYKAMLTTICNLFKGTTVTRITILNEMWYITNANLGYSSFINECLNIVKSAGYTTGLTMAGFTSNQKLSDAVIQNIDTFYINVYPGISGSGKYITKQEAIEAFNQCDVDLWIAKLKKDYPNKKIIISEMGTNDYWECLAAPSSWNVTGASKTGGYAVDTYITAMMEFFIRNNVEIEELWWWYDLYYAPVKETLLNYLGGDR